MQKVEYFKENQLEHVTAKSEYLRENNGTCASNFMKNIQAKFLTSAKKNCTASCLTYKKFQNLINNDDNKDKHFLAKL